MEQELIREDVLRTLSSIDQLWGPILVGTVLTFIALVALQTMYRRT